MHIYATVYVNILYVAHACTLCLLLVTVIYYYLRALPESAKCQFSKKLVVLFHMLLIISYTVKRPARHDYRVYGRKTYP